MTHLKKVKIYDGTETSNVDSTNRLEVSGSVNINSSLPAGTNNIGDVDVLSMPDIDISADISSNIKAIKDAVEVMDDWDSSNTCKVTLQASDGTDIGNVDVITLPDQIENDITAISSNTKSIDTALGGTITVTDDGSFTLAANDGTDIGDVSVNNTVTVDGSVTIQEPLSVDDNGSSITVDTTGTSGIEVIQGTSADLKCTEANSSDIKSAVETIDDIVKSEDAVHSSGDKGVMTLAVRQDDLGTTKAADGDYIPLIVNKSGQLYTTDINSKFISLDDINYNYSKTGGGAASSSTWHRCREYRYATIGFELNVTGAPTDIKFEVEVDLGDGNARKLMNDFLGDWRFDDTVIGVGGLDESLMFPIAASGIRLSVTCTGDDGSSKYFSVSGAHIYMRN